MTPSSRVPAGRVGVLVSRYNETVTERLLAGAAPQLMGFDPSGKPILTMPVQPQQTVQVMPQEAPIAQAAE